jgi:hypothetical protein
MNLKKDKNHSDGIKDGNFLQAKEKIPLKSSYFVVTGWLFNISALQ